ncbi:MAG: aminotransferase class I/II-fold pyridoxal phosphate-dependent enzyme, partial [Gammaproteobacteria bacterium]
MRQRTSYAHGNSRCAKNRAGEWLNFSSNDYLGLATDRRLVAAAQQALERYGVGSGGSQFISGYHPLHAELEQRLAEFTGRDRALLFASGYQANLGTFTALLKRHDNVFPDRLVHASIIDALRLSHVALRRFAHNDMTQLQDLLAHAS